jgi:hypothetical protein
LVSFFGRGIFSVKNIMKKAETFGDTWIDMDLPFDCEIHTYIPRPTVSATKKVLLMCTEPRAGLASNEWVLGNYKKFDLIIAYDRQLAHLPNVVIHEFGGVLTDEKPKKKDFSISFLLSTGGNASHYHGYQLRRNVALNFGWPNVPGRLYLSSRRLTATEDEMKSIHRRSFDNNYSVTTIGESKLPVFESMFHVAIENHNDDYFFTEKLVECFRTYTLPIYWGTDKIFEFFDKEGIIFVNSAEEMDFVVSKLTPLDYWNRISSMNNNYNLSSRYLNFVDNIRQLIIGKLQN